jgi:hypothetical protein
LSTVPKRADLPAASSTSAVFSAAIISRSRQSWLAVSGVSG